MTHPLFAPAWLRTSIWMSAMAATGMLVLTGCNDKAPAPATAVAPVISDPLLVTIAPEQALNYKTGPVATADVAMIQEHPGRIEANERLVTRIGATVTGRVTQVLAELGDTVRPGQTLAQVSSPELTTAQLAYLRASAGQALAERAEIGRASCRERV